jgi:hypothetical protein
MIPTARMAAIRTRLEASSTDETSLRVMLVLAHELERRQQLAPDATVGATRTAPTVAAWAEAPDDYRQMIAHVHEAVSRSVPPESLVLVVSRGDDALLAPGYAAAHFPQAPGGGYAGYYPADSDAALAQLEACVRAGAQFLVIPATAYWWLDYYGGLAQMLLARGRVRHHDEHCLIFELQAPPPEGAA